MQNRIDCKTRGRGTATTVPLPLIIQPVKSPPGDRRIIKKRCQAGPVCAIFKIPKCSDSVEKFENGRDWRVRQTVHASYKRPTGLETFFVCRRACDIDRIFCDTVHHVLRRLVSFGCFLSLVRPTDLPAGGKLYHFFPKEMDAIHIAIDRSSDDRDFYCSRW